MDTLAAMADAAWQLRWWIFGICLFLTFGLLVEALNRKEVAA